MKRVLFISDVPSHPIQGGNLQSMQAYVKILKELNFEVYFFFGYDFNCPAFFVEGTKKYWGNNFLYYKQPLFIALIQFFIRKTDRFIQKATKKYEYKIKTHYLFGMNRVLKKTREKYQFDIIFVNYIWNTEACKIFPDTKKILFTHDVFSSNFYENRNRKQRIFSTSEIEEAQALNRCDVILSVQENESKYFKTLTDKKVYTSYSPIRGHDTPFSGNKNILYLGSDNPFNIESIHDFVKFVFPLLQKKIPESKIFIAGSICDSFDKSLQGTNVILLGKIQDVGSFYALGDIVINPTKNGSGLKIKSIEALAYNKVLISHPHSIEGLFDINNLPIILASTPKEYTDAIAKLFDNQPKIKKIKENTALYMNNYNQFVKEQIKKAFTE